MVSYKWYGHSSLRAFEVRLLKSPSRGKLLNADFQKRNIHSTSSSFPPSSSILFVGFWNCLIYRIQIFKTNKKETNKFLPKTRTLFCDLSWHFVAGICRLVHWQLTDNSLARLENIWSAFNNVVQYWANILIQSYPVPARLNLTEPYPAHNVPSIVSPFRFATAITLFERFSFVCLI